LLQGLLVRRRRVDALAAADYAGISKACATAAFSRTLK
jgi:hypothetical protein